MLNKVSIVNACAHLCMTWAARAQAPDTWKLREILDPNAPPSRLTSTVTLKQQTAQSTPLHIITSHENG